MLGGMRVQVNEPPWSLWYVERVVGETSPLHSKSPNRIPSVSDTQKLANAVRKVESKLLQIIFD